MSTIPTLPIAWFVARGAGLVSFAFLTASVWLGLAMSTRLLGSRRQKRLLGLHRTLSWMGLTALGLHAGALLLDPTIGFGPAAVLVLFAAPWHPAAVAGGVVAGWLMLMLAASFRFRNRIGQRTWRKLRVGEALGDVDLGGRTARLGGEPVRWRRLVLATGAAPRRLPMVPTAANVHHLRGLDDAGALAGDLARGGRLVVIGAGFVGAEVASSARSLGVDVTIVEALPVPFAATLGPSVGRRLAALYRSHGVDLRLGQGVGRVALRDGRAVSVELADGAAPGVHACGDVASPWRPELGGHRRLEHWTAASTGGAAVARAITGRPSPPPPPPYFWSDQFGWRLQMVGHAAPGADAAIEEREDGFVARYRDEAGAVTAALAVNRPSELSALRDEVRAAATASAGP